MVAQAATQSFALRWRGGRVASQVAQNARHERFVRRRPERGRVEGCLQLG